MTRGPRRTYDSRGFAIRSMSSAVFAHPPLGGSLDRLLKAGVESSGMRVVSRSNGRAARALSQRRCGERHDGRTVTDLLLGLSRSLWYFLVPAYPFDPAHGAGHPSPRWT